MLIPSRLALAIALLLCAALPAAWAHDGHLRAVYLAEITTTSNPLIMQGMVDALDAFGFLDRADFDVFMRATAHGDAIEITLGGIDLDPAAASLQIGEFIDEGYEVLITSSTIAAQLAANATQNMDEPPLVLFVGVDDPYRAGLASSPCIKLPNVSGTQSVVPYDEVVAALRKLDPEITTIGALHNSSDPAGISGAAAIAEKAEALGLAVVARAYTDVPSMSLAGEALIENGAEAIVLPNEAGAAQALVSVLHPMMSDANIPIIAADAGLVYSQATIGIGSINYYHWGINIGRLLVAHLHGEIDIAKAAIAPASLALSMGVNLGVAAEAGIEIPTELLEEADFHLAGFASHLTEKGKQNTWQVESMRALGDFLAQFTTPETFEFVQGAALPDLREGQAEFIDSVRCTPERIAEEQAALDAAGDN